MSTEIDLLIAMLKQHADDDTRRFEAHGEVLTEIRDDVKSLVLARAKQKGAWVAITAIGSGVSVVISGLFAFVSWLVK